MEFVNEYRNVFTVKEVDSLEVKINDILKSIYTVDVTYVIFGKEQLFDKILSNIIMDEFLKDNKHMIEKHNFVVVSLNINERLINISIGGLPNGDTTEYISGIVTN